jgi:hypothetical protein
MPTRSVKASKHTAASMSSRQKLPDHRSGCIRLITLQQRTHMKAHIHYSTVVVVVVVQICIFPLRGTCQMHVRSVLQHMRGSVQPFSRCIFIYFPHASQLGWHTTRRKKHMSKDLPVCMTTPSSPLPQGFVRRIVVGQDSSDDLMVGRRRRYCGSDVCCVWLYWTTIS